MRVDGRVWGRVESLLGMGEVQSGFVPFGSVGWFDAGARPRIPDRQEGRAFYCGRMFFWDVDVDFGSSGHGGRLRLMSR